MESLNSNESSVVSCDLESESNDSAEKPPSPILSNSKINRRIFLGRKLNRQKSRVKLATRFEQESPRKQNESVDDKINLNEFFNQNDSIEERMKKIKQLEIERKKYYDYLSKESKNVPSERKQAAEFQFKKPPSNCILNNVKLSNDQDLYNLNVGKDNAKCVPLKLDSFKQPMKAKAKLSKIPRPKSFVPDNIVPNFHSASGKPIDISDNHMNKFKGIFSDENFDDILCVTPSNKRVLFKTPSGKNLIITESLISMADKMIMNAEEDSNLKKNFSVFSTNTMNKLFTNDKFDELSTSTTDSLDIFGYRNSFETPSDFTTSFYRTENTESFSTVFSSNLIKENYFEHNGQLRAVSDPQIVNLDDLLSGMDSGNNSNESVDKNENFDVNKDTEVQSNTLVNKNIQTDDAVLYDDVNATNGVKLNIVTLIHSQPHVDNDDFSFNNQENFIENINNTMPKNEKFEIEQTNVVEVNNVKEDNSPGNILAGNSSKNVINLCITPSVMACQAEMHFSKKLVELHKNQNFVGNSEDSFCGYANMDYQISQHSVEVRQKTLKSAECEGFTKYEQKTAEEKVQKIIKNVKKLDNDVQIIEKNLKYKTEKRTKDKKNKKPIDPKNVIDEVIEEEGDVNVIEQEEHPNLLAKYKKSKRKKDKPKQKNTQPDCNMPILKKIKYDSQEAPPNEHKIPQDNANPVKKFCEKKNQEIVMYDHLSIISEKSCKKYKSHKKRKSTDIKETNGELVHLSPARQSFELNSNQRKFKIEIDCRDKFRINISCNGTQNDQINIIENGSVKLKQKAIEESGQNPENKSQDDKKESIDGDNKALLSGDKTSINGTKASINQDNVSINEESRNEDKAIRNEDKTTRNEDTSRNDDKTSRNNDKIPRNDEKTSRNDDKASGNNDKTRNENQVFINDDKSKSQNKSEQDYPDYCSLGLGKERLFKKILNKAHKIYRDIKKSDVSISSDKGAKESRSSKNTEKHNEAENKKAEKMITCGFKSASGKDIEISEDLLKKARHFYDKLKIENNENEETSHDKKNVDMTENTESSERRTRVLYQDLRNNSNLMQPSSLNNGFTTASGKPIKLSENALQKGEKLFNGIQRLTPLEEKMEESNKHIKEFKYNFLFDKDGLSAGDFKNDFVVGFMSASGKKVGVKQDSLNKAQKMYEECKNVDLSKGDFETEACMPDISKMLEYRAENANLNVTATTSKRAFELLEDVVSTVDSALEKIKSRSPKSTGSKKRLGLSKSKQIVIPKEKLEKAKLLFEEDSISPQSFSTPSKSSVYHSTPVRNKPDSHDPTPLINLTPIKSVKDCGMENFELASNVLFHSKTEGGIDKWQSDLTEQINELKRRLTILGERKRGLEIQKDSLGVGHKDYRRQKLGSLYKRKQESKNRLSLKNLQHTENVELSEDILQITSKNAETLHFRAGSSGKSETDIEKTLDEAMVIPNVKNLIGISEIESAFRTMSGVDHTLIPKGWISNHYRLIVWKLASYERFSHHLKGCLSIDNIIQQLKYRYDREIDRAQRPAVRKILEKDDVPQKRMVLCVSDVYQLNDKNFELELTDGWYCIKTIIDEPLSRQVLNNKISIGTKLMIQGAELMNCESCHPLEVPEFVKLKITYNSTRRAAWHVKLGYQSNPGPLLIPMKTIHPNGGNIGCMKVQIVRVYPIRYMEQLEDIKIWRNGKAEEKRKKEFENERVEKIERIRREVQKEQEKTAAWENKNRSLERSKLNKTEISKITCARTLYNLIESSNDPDSLMEMLSPSQCNSIIEYRETLSMQMEYDRNAKIALQVEKLKLLERKVIPMLKLLVLDVNDDIDKGYTFCIWRPTPEHEEMLREDLTFMVYNVAPRSNGDLFSNSKTCFKFVRKFASVHTKLKRQVFPIAMTLDPYYRPVFHEFDTVGLVVQVTIKNHDQHVWVTDCLGRLLFVKIKEGPKCCSLLDGLSRESVVTLSNLIYCKPQKEFGQAVANQFSVVTMYPQQKFLQEALDMFKIQLPKDVVKLLKDCDKIIEKCVASVETKQTFSRSVQNNSLFSTRNNFSAFLDESLEDSVDIPSGLTSMDIAMSLIDTDQLN